MSEKSPAYKKALENGTPFTLWLYSCEGAGMAQKISAAHPNAYVVGATGYVHWGQKNGNPAIVGISSLRFTNLQNRTFVVYRNGQESYRLPFAQTIIFNKK